MNQLIEKIKFFYPRIARYEKWLSLIFWFGAIYYLSAQPSLFADGISIFAFILRKLAHVFEFGVLAFLIYRVLDQADSQKYKINLLFSFLFAVLFAALDEFHQTTVFGRSGVWTDVLIDSGGVLITVWLIWVQTGIFVRRSNLKLKKQN